MAEHIVPCVGDIRRPSATCVYILAECDRGLCIPSAMIYSLVFTSVCLVSPTVALHLPFTRRTTPSRSGALSRPATNVLAQSGSLTLNNRGNNFYSSTLNVAGKGKSSCNSVPDSRINMFSDVPMNLDTGSTDLWLYNYADGLLDSAIIHVSFSFSFNPFLILTDFSAGASTY